MPPKRKSSTVISPNATAKRARSPSGNPRPRKPAPTKTIELPSYKPKLVPNTTDTSDADTSGYTLRQTKVCPKEAAERCQSCIEKQAILGGCRFVGLRVFRVSQNAKGRKVTDWKDYAFRGNQDDEVKQPVEKEKRKEKKSKSTRSTRNTKGPEDEAPPESQNDLPPAIPPTTEDAAYTLPLIAPTFATHLRRELEHETTHLQDPATNPDARPLIRIQNTPLTRSLCDFCSTSIFMGSYMCSCCGREFCLGCWETWTPSSEVISGRLLRRNQCSQRRRHEKSHIIFVTRAKPGELEELLKDAESRITASLPFDKDADAELVAAIPKETAPPPPNGGATYLPVPKTSINTLTPEAFRALWRSDGIPLVLTDFLPRFKLPWSPDYFIAHHGQDSCILHDCTTSDAISSTVAEFFNIFSTSSSSSPQQNPVSWKLKDWPPSADFSTTFPALFADFENAVPMPEYTRRTGSRNLASEYYFPKTWNPPDLGPKMYNALPALDFLQSEAVDTCENDKGDGGGQDGEEAEEEPRVIGTTNLHLDLTDAVNILLYADSADPCPYDTTATLSVPACGAIWDIFPPSASASIRSYLRKTRPLTCSTVPDPIHLQLFYLSAQDLLRLSKPPYNVHSYRIFQDPGEAVFIPAGCAHQVRNRKASVKVAVDFLSPESVQRGVQTELTEELRACWKEDMVGRKGGREDVLQLWKCLEFAWRSLRTVEEGKEGEKVQSDDVKGEEEEEEQEKKEIEGDKLNGSADTIAPSNAESNETIVVANGSEQPAASEQPSS